MGCGHRWRRSRQVPRAHLLGRHRRECHPRLGTHSKLYVTQGGTLAEITPTGIAAGNEDGVGGPGFGADSFGTGPHGTPRSNYYPRTWAPIGRG